MDREALLEQLAHTERLIALGEVDLAKQQSLVAEMDRDGRDATQARKILATLRDTQTLHEQDRERLLRDLSALP
jgi:hypothetical protein